MANSPIPLGHCLLVPKVDVSWNHEFIQGRRDISASLPGAPFTVESMSPSRDGLDATVGLDLRVNEFMTVYANVGTLWDGSHGHSEDYQIGVSMKF